MRSAFALSSLVLALALAGCKANSLDGKWNVQGVEGQLPGTTATYEFANGQATMILNIQSAQTGQIGATITGPYKLEGEKLTLDAKDIKIDDSKVNPMYKQFLSSPQMKAAMTKGLAENKEYTLKFDSSDQVLLTGKQGKTVTLTRVK
ncbi:hypothetical protein EON77_01065 [bacterium]|nr:MAG: hypothetical protein EON77_01065 [bacterium]